VNVSDFDLLNKCDLDPILNSPSARAMEEIQRTVEGHLRPFDDLRLRMEEMTAPLRDLEYRMKDLTAGLRTTFADQMLASSATAYLASIPTAFDTLKHGAAFEAARELSAAANLTEAFRPIVPEPNYYEPTDLPVLPVARRRDAEIDALRDRIENLEAEVDDLKAQMNPSDPDPEEVDNRPFPGLYL
jgi:hypothetical protein